MRFMKFTAGMLLALLLTCTAQAEVVLSVTNEVDDAGTTLDVTVSIAATTGSAVLTNYNIPILLGADPLNQFTLNSIDSTEPNGWENFRSPATGGAPFNFDFATADSGAGITLSNIPTDLFTLNFSIDPTAPAGSQRDIEIQRNPTVAGQLQLTLDGTSINSGSGAFDDVAISNGSVSVTAVPEPSALCGLFLAGLFVAGRRKRS